MANTQLVKRIWVGSRKIRNDYICLEQFLIHLHIDGAGMCDLVGTNAFDSFSFQDRPDQQSIGFIQIELATVHVVGFGAKAHDHKTSFFGISHI